MDSNIGNINNIPILDVLNKLGYSEGINYIIKGNNIRMKSGGELTDGWIGDIKNNRLYARSGLKSGRFEGDIIGVIKGALGLEASDAISWAEDNFNLIKMDKKVEEKKIDFTSIPKLSDKSAKYLEERGIDYKLLGEGIVRGDDKVYIPIVTENLNIVGSQSRALEGDKKFRYRIEGTGDGIFCNGLSKASDKDVVFVVEGMTDYLTLRQFTNNVIGLVSAKTGIKYLKSFHNSYKLIYIADNDEAGKQSIEKFRDEGLIFGTYTIDESMKDVNDLWMSYKEYGLDGKQLMKDIYGEADRPKTNLELAFDKAVDIKDKGVLSFGDKVLDMLLGGLMRGSNILINGPSGQGKTTLSLHIMRCLLREHRGKKIVYYSLETNIGRQLMQIIAFMEGVSEEQVFNNLSSYKEHLKALEGLEVYDKIRSMEDIQNHIDTNGVDIAFIDFCQKVRVEGIVDETTKMIRYAQGMQDFAIENGNVAIISLSQTSMGNYRVPILDRVPKSSGALFESSDTTINVGRDENGKWCLGIMKTKNIGAKGWYTICDTSYKPHTGEYLIFPPADKVYEDKNKTGRKIGL